jgi:hypothetical protein
LLATYCVSVLFITTYLIFATAGAASVDLSSDRHNTKYHV